MTPNPSCVPPNASAIDALRKMVSGQFRHLPVADDEKGRNTIVSFSMYDM
jgi:CBS domain-containing protein